jgi:phosphatidylglycerophosphate synthase
MNLATIFTLSRVHIAPLFAFVFISGYRTPANGWIWIAYLWLL